MGSPAGQAHRRFHNVWLHDVCDRLKLRRHTIARDSGLDTAVVETFPTAPSVVNVRFGGLASTLGAGLLALICVAAGAAGVYWFLPKASKPPAVESQATPKAQEFEVTFWRDGQEIAVDEPEEPPP